MTDPAGGHGWRSGRQLGLGRLAERAAPPVERPPLCVLLLPRALEQMPERERVEQLLAAPGVAAVEPARVTAGRPAALADALAMVQARRLRLPGNPRAIVLFDPRQYRLARALLALHPDAELWYGGTGEGPLHELAGERAALRFSAPWENRVLWERMERLGIESGRLGSERLT
jgi:hypothetical protein